MKNRAKKAGIASLAAAAVFLTAACGYVGNLRWSIPWEFHGLWEMTDANGDTLLLDIREFSITNTVTRPYPLLLGGTQLISMERYEAISVEWGRFDSLGLGAQGGYTISFGYGRSITGLYKSEDGALVINGVTGSPFSVRQGRYARRGN